MFSTTFRYALIALLDLAHRQDCVQASSLASRYNLSRNYMATVLADLRRLGWISSQKGNRGGYSLQIDPAQLTILQIYKAVNGSGVISWQQSLDLQEDSPADDWLLSIGQRWDQELEATTLKQLLAGENRPTVPARIKTKG